ncbi:hypothetical protein ACWD5R_34440 [Streptomyces sp. NPDC002514]|uniref:hypothetical protein n=1 Tax=Streptomyces sp. NPDC001270 TaxID=3364554 RepID=UPI0036B91ED0
MKQRQSHGGCAHRAVFAPVAGRARVDAVVQDGARTSAGALAERCVRESTARLVAVRLTLCRVRPGHRHAP